MNIFNAAEVVNLGIEKKRKRRDFYGLVAGRFHSEDLKELFTKLKRWEDEPIHRFTEIRKTVEDQEPVESYQGELSAYMQALVDDRLYAEISSDNFSANVKSPLSAIQYSIDFEKDAILFFSELLPYTRSVNKDLMVELINEEKKHIVYLNELKNKMKQREGSER
jgi:rubrerythrin